jgi:ParB-like chromosome segregation protein Spo0J
MEELKIEMWDIARPIEHARNPKKHPTEQVAQIVNSFKEFQMVEPIIVDERGVILAGHGRFMAAKQLQYKQIPVVQVKHLSGAQKTALMVTLNKLTMNSGFDMEILKENLADLKSMQFDLSVTGLKLKEFDSIFINDDDNKSDKKTKKTKEADLSKDLKKPFKKTKCPNCGHEFGEGDCQEMF